MKQSTTAKIVREARGGIPEPLFLADVEGHTFLVDPSGVSVLAGDMAAWMRAHLIEKGTEPIEFDSEELVIRGITHKLPLQAPPPLVADTTTPEVLALPSVVPVVDAIPPSVPVEPLPAEPSSPEEWVALIQATPPNTNLPTLETPSPDEPIGRFTERVLLPHNITLAAAVHSDTFRAALTRAAHESWGPLHAALRTIFPEKETVPNG